MGRPPFGVDAVSRRPAAGLFTQNIAPCEILRRAGRRPPPHLAFTNNETKNCLFDIQSYIMNILWYLLHLLRYLLTKNKLGNLYKTIILSNFSVIAVINGYFPLRYRNISISGNGSFGPVSPVYMSQNLRTFSSSKYFALTGFLSCSCKRGQCCFLSDRWILFDIVCRCSSVRYCG